MPRDIRGDFIPLFVSSRKCQKTYSKNKKIQVFYKALTVTKSKILGNSPPQVVITKYNLWRGAISHWSKWTLDAIAESIFIIGRHVNDREEKKIRKNDGSASSDSKVEALVLMFKFFCGNQPRLSHLPISEQGG